ncbi:MAG: secretion protein HlyD family protein [Sphingomonas bacterium]|nr:secretion protein HlyD family protein [Sphingomonas bacterium]
MNEMTSIAGDEVAPPKTRRWRTPLMLSVPLLLIAVGLYFWLSGGSTVSTDNAQVGAHVIAVAPEVGGRIVEVRVAENQKVKAGDLLYRIDPAPYRIALMQADAAVGNARLQISQMQSGVSARVADIGEKASEVELARENFRRQRELLDRGFTTRSAFDAARAALTSAEAQRNSAAAEAQSARAMLGMSAQGGHPQVEAALAQRAKAALDLARTEIRAPVDGIVAQADKLQPGALAMQMLSNVSLVGGGDYWVEANFKETQLAQLRVGQEAEVEIDAMPGKPLKGHVIGIGAGTGSEFSLLPAQNATGNWVKVTQRVPVRIKLDQAPARPLVSGWSAHVTVRVAD